MSTLQVENLIGPTSGSNANKVIIPSGQTLDASNGFVAPAGSVIQYASISTSTTSFSTTSTSYLDSGADIFFSPKFTNSKIQVTLQSRRFNLVSASTMNVICKRNDLVDIGIQQNAQDVHYHNSTSTSSNQIAYPLHYMWEDSPATTDEIKYSIYFKVSNGIGYLADSGGVQLYVQEIAQ
jgi:maltoporin